MFSNPHVQNQEALSARVYEYYNNKKVDRNLAQATDGYVFHHFGFGPTMIDPSKATEEEITAEIQQQEHKMTSCLIEHLKGDTITNALDIACGRGGNMFRIIDDCPQSKVEGINIAEYQVDFCKRSIADRNIADRASVTLADFLDMPYADESFSHAYCSEVTQYAVRLEDLFQEVERVLAPGGRFVIATWCYDETASVTDLKEIIEPINDHYASTMHSNARYKEALANANLTLIEEDDCSELLIPYWELRDVWGLKSGIEPNFIRGHKEKTLIYKFFIAEK